MRFAKRLFERVLPILAVIILGLRCGFGGEESASSDSKGKVRDAVSPSKPKHVLVIILDTLRADRLGVYGKRPSVTPAIDGFAGQSVLYKRAHSPSSWTKTAVASVLTGLNPYRHQVFEEKHHRGVLPESAVTIAEVLKKRGYQTAAVTMNPHISKTFGYAQGFDAFYHQESWVDESTDWGTKTAIKHLEKADRSKPQHLFIHYLDPHDPWPARRLCGRFPDGKEPTNPHVKGGWAFELSGERALKGVTDPRIPVPVKLSREALSYLEWLYDCEVGMVDASVGKLLDYLKKANWLDHSLVILTSDHGEEFLDHGMLRHGYQLFEETTHVPLIVRAPKIAPAIRNDLVSTMDIPSTIYHLLGIPDDGKTDGTLLPGLGSSVKKAPSRVAFGMTQFRKQHLAYLIKAHLKIVHNFKSNQCHRFDLATDPLEKRSSPCDQHDDAEGMLSTLMSIQDRAEKTALKVKPWSKKQKPVLSDAQKQQLKSLGYLAD